jgi:hypothetical protein
MITHIHPYKFDSKLANAHKHFIYGYTINLFGVSNFHFHTFKGISSHNGHFHSFSGFTGFPTKTEFGHIHKIEGQLILDNGHKHKLCDFTFEEISFIESNIFMKSFVKI